LGSTGKLGTAVERAFSHSYEVVGMSRRDFDAENPVELQHWVDHVAPDVVVNAVAFSGIDACAREPERARAINALLPWRLAELSRERGFVLAHASSDAVFGTVRGRSCVESEPLRPINMYGYTKALGDAFVQAGTPHGYVFRFSVLFGESTRENQFVERMLERIRNGERRLEISHDVITTPSYSRDVAAEMRWIIDAGLSPGVYHVANDGWASLYELMCEVVSRLELDVDLVPVSHERFPAVARKNVETVLSSERIAPLRPWREAVGAYCDRLQPRFEKLSARKQSEHPRPVLGIDLDNTLVCYDELFHTLASERGYIDSRTPRAKRAVRDAMFEAGLDDAWTELQAVAYGTRLAEARPFPGALETLRTLHARGVELRIVSHKTRFPARGEAVDLRARAMQWLIEQKVVDPSRTGIHEGRVYFEDDRAAKAARVRALGCTHFVDDLREFLLGPDFPAEVERYLFDPTGGASGDASVETVRHWDQLRERVAGPIAKPASAKSEVTTYRSP
jgi:dTDP-4-dehydrorhamnose reductase